MCLAAAWLRSMRGVQSTAHRSTVSSRFLAVCGVGFTIHKWNIAYAMSAADIPRVPDMGVGLWVKGHSDRSTP